MDDHTQDVQNLIDRAEQGGTVVIPGRYNINAEVGVRLKSGITLQIDGTLAAIPNALTHYDIIKVSGCSNVKITGHGVIQGERDQHTGQGGEWGMGIRIDGGSSNVTVEGVTITKCWGDGVYVDGASNVSIEGIVSDGNRRQGASIIDVNGLKIRNSIFQNIGGTAPGDGIDLECDRPEQTIANVLIEFNTFRNTQGSSIGIGSPNGTYRRIVVRNNSFDRKSQPLWRSGQAGRLGAPAQAVILNALFEKWSGYRWWGYPTEVTI